MELEQHNKPIADLVNKNSTLIFNSEKITTSILIIGIFLYLFKIRETDIVLVIGAISSAILYFFTAFIVFGTENHETTGFLNSIPFLNFIYKLTYLGLAITCACLISLVFPFRSVITLCFVCFFTLGFVLFLSLITRLNDRSYFYNTAFYSRIISALFILFYILNLNFHWIKL